MKDNLAFEFFNILLPASKVEETIGNVKELINSGDIHEEIEDNVLKAELYIANLSQKKVPFTSKILSDISIKIYGKIYSWAGKIRMESRGNVEDLLAQIKKEWDVSLVDEEVRLDLMAKAYHSILSIRPFFDGNEKVARLFVNYLALKYDLHLFEIAPKKKDENAYRKYIKALKTADAGDLGLIRDRICNVLYMSADGITNSKLGPSGSVGD